MRMTKATQNISLMYKNSKLDEGQILHKSKLLLSIYRDVVWSVQDYSFSDDLNVNYCSYNLQEALIYLNEFAPTEKKEKFIEKVSSIFETKWIIELIDNAMMKIYDYPNNGKLYHEILLLYDRGFYERK